MVLSAPLLEEAPPKRCQRYGKYAALASLLALAASAVLAIRLTCSHSLARDAYATELDNAAVPLGGEFWPQAEVNISDFPFVYVILGPEGQPLARAIVKNTDSCPSIHVDGAAVQPSVQVRAVGRSARGTAEDPRDFPVRVCEALLPRKMDGGSFGGRPLPRLTPRPSDFALMGDSGLRVKPKNDGTCRKFAHPKRELYGIAVCEESGPFDPSLVKGDFQALNNWGMHEVFGAAAATRPEVVVHVGDFLYRQGPCAENAGCAEINPNREWGDTWRGWATDLFIPARPLFEAAPWIVVRGDHETCSRAGYGWFLFLDPSPYPTGVVGGHHCLEVTAGYRIPFDSIQLIVLDDSVIEPLGGQTGDWGGTNIVCRGGSTAHARSRFDDPDQKREAIEKDIAHFAGQFDLVREAAAKFSQNIYVSHRPVFGIACNGTNFVTMDWTMQEAAARVPGSMDRITLAIGGHMHRFQELEFEGHGHPTQLIVGNSGTKLINDTVKREVYSNHSLKVRGKWISAGVTSSHHFGFVTLTRKDSGRHTATPIFVNRDGGWLAPLGTIKLPRFAPE